MNQSELIKHLSDEELKKNVLFSQGLFFMLALLLSVFLFDNFFDWQNYFIWNTKEILYYGILPGLIIVSVDFILMRVFPKSAFDDGGMNERIFQRQSVFNIFVISFVVAVSEEFLFRGVIQTTFGYVFASILFAVVHVRYLKKPVLFLSVVFVSLYIGYIFLITENLIITITIHFVVDFLLGLYIRFKSEVQSH